MNLYTIGFTQKSAEQFFGRIRYHGIEMLVDVRLKNDSQLYGFARKRDLPYFLGLHGCKYEHSLTYAPTEELLTAWRDKAITWAEYERQYKALMKGRNAVIEFLTCYEGLYDRVCLLCAEPTPENCHRRLLAEMIASMSKSVEVIHL